MRNLEEGNIRNNRLIEVLNNFDVIIAVIYVVVEYFHDKVVEYFVFKVSI